MTPIELEMLRGGNASKQSQNNKIYLIISEKQKKYNMTHTGFTSPSPSPSTTFAKRRNSPKPSKA
jgi:hypothetical protein